MTLADSGVTQRAMAFAIAFMLLVLIALSILPHTDARAWLFAHSVLQTLFIDAPAVALAVIAFRELRHSGEANEERRKANDYRKEANELRRQVLLLNQQLGIEQNKNLHLIAEHTKPSKTEAERNAEILRKYLGEMASVTMFGDWAGSKQIVKIENEIVTLFTPKGVNSSSAFATLVHCRDLEVVDIPHGSCPVRISVRKRYGQDISLGEITKWEDRDRPAAAVPAVVKGNFAYHATFTKPGSPETKNITIFQSKDFANLFVMEVSPGDEFIGNNVDISKQFLARRVDYEADGFGVSNSNSGSTTHRLYI